MKVKEKLHELFIALSITMIVSACSTPAEKLKEARKDMTASNDALSLTNQAYEADLQRYRLKITLLIAANDSLMAEFKVSLKSASKETNPYYKNQIKDLGQQNTEMKTKMDEYHGDENDDWLAFKKEFSQDMAELAQAFDHLSVKSTGPHKSRVY